MKPMKKVALLHSLCSVGKASLTNMIPIISTMGIEVCPIPTVLLSTHTGGYGMPAIQSVTPEYIHACADHYVEQNITFDMIFIGYLGNVDMVSAVAYFTQKFPNATVILDPILGDHGKYYSNMNSDYCKAFRKLLPYADIILPNLTEACFLTDMPYNELPDQEQLYSITTSLHRLGAKNIIITSVEDDEETIGVYLSTSFEVNRFKFHKESVNFHGSGDVFDAVFMASILQRHSIENSIRNAHAFVSKCISKSAQLKYPEEEGLVIELMLSELV